MAMEKQLRSAACDSVAVTCSLLNLPPVLEENNQRGAADISFLDGRSAVYLQLENFDA